MNKSLSLLLLCLLTFTGMLTAQNRRSSDACPGLNNKKPTGQYASLSKRSGSNASFASPKYQHLYAKNRTAAASIVKNGSASPVQKKTKQKAEQEDEFIPAKDRNASSRSIREEKEHSSEQQPETTEELSPVSNTTEGGKMRSAGPGTEQTETVQAAAADKKALVLMNGTEEKSPADAPAAKKSSSSKPVAEKTSAYEKYTGDKAASRTAGNTGTKAKSAKRKKLCIGKKNADSCPEF